jgi:hypothetical protein
MKSIVRSTVIVSLACSAWITAANSPAASAGEEPAAAPYYRFLGKWQGQGELSEPGNTPIKLAISLSCRKVSLGSGVACEMTGKNNSMQIAESDLFGVDPVTGQGHWYAVTNQGETHDHLAEWSDANTMKAHYDWAQDGKRMKESIEFRFQGKNAVTFRSVVSADGKPAGEFSGSLKALMSSASR